MKAKVLKMGATPDRQAAFLFLNFEGMSRKFLNFFFQDTVLFFYMTAADMVGGVEPLTSIVVLQRERCDSTSFL